MTRTTLGRSLRAGKSPAFLVARGLARSGAVADEESRVENLEQERREGQVHPGFTATDLNNHAGQRTPAQGAVAAVRMATIPADGPTGTFTDDQGPVPW